VFNTKRKQAAEAQRAEAEALRARLDEIARQNSELEQRLAALVQANAELDHRLGTTGARLVGLEQGVDDIGQQIDGLAATRDAPPSPLPPPPPLVDSAANESELNERIEALREQLTALSEQTSVIDSRVTNVSTELTNQLVELSRDIETLNRGNDVADDPAGPALDTAELEARIAERVDAAIDDVLDATERLAAEQARYEIRFRADLAELADRLRRPSAP
jgi:DNA repair exonuclease SbcCD ATPase subunit